MAGQEAFLLDGGMGVPTLSATSSVGRQISLTPKPHHGVIGLVLLAVVVLVLLDRAGFRFAFTAGRR